MSDDICNLSIRTISKLYRDRSLSPVDVVDAYLARIERLNPTLNAYVRVTAEAAKRQAAAAEQRLHQSPDELPELFGIPFSVKDTLPTAGVTTTFGSPLFADFVPGEDAAAVAALKRAGAILLGKTNTPALGWVGVTQNQLFGATPNPWQLTLTAGGSSGGTAVAACAKLAPINIGTDGGGSLRIPAAFTGTVGFKPSYGRVPNYPTGPNWSLQHVGPIARNVDDLIKTFDAIALSDDRDPYSLPASTTPTEIWQRGRSKPLKILFAADLGYAEAIEPGVIEVCRRAVSAFEDVGHHVSEQKLDWPSPISFWKTLFIAGAADRLGPFVEKRGDEIEPGLRNLVVEGLNLPKDAYLKAWLARNDWWQTIRPTFDDYDLLVTPTVACSPFALGLETPGTVAGQAVSFYGWSPFCPPFNLTGQPAISVPAGRTADNLPAGLQIVGRRFADATVLSAALTYEKLRPWPEWTIDR